MDRMNNNEIVENSNKQKPTVLTFDHLKDDTIGVRMTIPSDSRSNQSTKSNRVETYGKLLDKKFDMGSAYVKEGTTRKHTELSESIDECIIDTMEMINEIFPNSTNGIRIWSKLNGHNEPSPISFASLTKFFKDVADYNINKRNLEEPMDRLREIVTDSKDYRWRVIEELKELLTKLDKLTEMLNRPKPSTMSDEARELLITQSEQMKAYADTLYKRLVSSGIPESLVQEIFYSNDYKVDTTTLIKHLVALEDIKEDVAKELSKLDSRSFDDEEANMVDALYEYIDNAIHIIKCRLECSEVEES